MAIAKQTARRSTGGRAPRTQLAQSCGLRPTYHFNISLQTYYRKRDLATEEASQPEPESRTRLQLSEPPELPEIPTSTHFGLMVRNERAKQKGISGKQGRAPECIKRPADMRICGRQAWTLMQREKHVETEKKSQPPPPPRRTRGRRLSVSTKPYATRQQVRIESKSAAVLNRYMADKQESCILLSKLPLELREEIFSLVLDIDSTLHLISRANRVGHLKCPEKSWYPHLSDCHCSATIKTATYLTDASVRHNIKLSHIELALLQTCRRAYREGIHFLYSRPVFQVDHPETLNWFARTVPPQRLATVTKLNISLGKAVVDWDTPKTQKIPFRRKEPKARRARNDGDLLRYWDPAWRTILSAMPGLKHLVVTLVGHEYDDHDYTEPVLKPLRELRGLTTFQLRLQGQNYSGSEVERLESLKDSSDTLQRILQSATSDRKSAKRKAVDLDSAPPPAAGGKKRRKRRRVY